MRQGELVSFGACETVLAGKTLEEVYALDIRAFMLESLEKWRGDH